MQNKYIQSVFQAVDARDATGLANFMTEDGIFRFANNPAVIGKSQIQPFLEGFFNSIQGISHSGIEVFELPGVFIINGLVTYTRHSGTTYACFFSNTFKMKGDKISEYLIFVDNSKLYTE
jgi:hypothetical protein